ncbi:tRNA (uracil-5-)-methyltransferase homolog B-like [Bacillus rossius redtenbacheri]|uniref:tRNA (uracil-5-)-methyltransferase homolog B-like n=1 Tax=Bacillus rossius redtenbacheri TaxID=93214 RepID=UPI002FDDAE53
MMLNLTNFGSFRTVSCRFSQLRKQLIAPVSSPVTAENQYECLADVMTPLWKLPYSEQLQLKQSWSTSVVKALASKVHSRSKKPGRRKQFTFVTVEEIKKSPVTEAYRNKDEFSIQVGVDGNPKTVGFFIGRPVSGSTVCVGGRHLINLKKRHVLISEAFERYIRGSELPACLHLSDGGHWRNLLVRSTGDGQAMAVVVFHPQLLEPQRVQEEAERVRQFFLEGAGRECGLSSLYFQACRNVRCTHQQAPFALLHGHSHLRERLSGCEFRISPDSFFQVNTEAAQVLYDTVLRLARPGPASSLLDVCCGTGAVSILASRRVRGAVGVDSVPDAVLDARHNAALNSALNTSFVCGRAEKKISQIIESLKLAGDIVAVANPGRSGLHEDAVAALGRCPQIRRLVYVSCKADSPSTMANFLQLITQGQFVLRRIVPVDLFPHTMHTELVMLFER